MIYDVYIRMIYNNVYFFSLIIENNISTQTFLQFGQRMCISGYEI